jgi:hypothetical protein
MAVLLTLVLLAAVIAVIASPLLRRHSASAPAPALESVDRAELQSAREAKYREIRDAELDYRTGKLSREDYEAVDSSLRAEALAILDGLEALEGEKAAD